MPENDTNERLKSETGENTICAGAGTRLGAKGCVGASLSSLSGPAFPFQPVEEEEEEPRSKHFSSTRNACKLCTPLGACLAFRGVEGCIPFLHGSQGCSTYIRRYLISHFREPIDIASSNFHEESAVFGGSSNFCQGVGNVLRQYQPKVVGVATTCLAETIGEDMGRLLCDLGKELDLASAPPIVHVSTASYRGTHIDGFHSAVRALVEQLSQGGGATQGINLFPGMVSAADLRELKRILEACGLSFAVLPDYSETMDGVTWSEYEKLQEGGTPLHEIRAMGRSRCSIEFGRVLEGTRTAAAVLQEKFGVRRHLLGLPIGVRETDALFEVLESLSGEPMPRQFAGERGRLIDAFIDGHKYVFEKRAIVYGEEDLVIGLTALVCEMGLTPVLCASGGRSGRLESSLRAAVPDLPASTHIREGFDFAEISEAAPALAPDLLVGSSKGYSLARKLQVPLVRAGFPVHDRIGGQRILHVGYRGAQEFFDRIVNALMAVKQEKSPVGYSYL